MYSHFTHCNDDDEAVDPPPFSTIFEVRNPSTLSLRSRGNRLKVGYSMALEKYTKRAIKAFNTHLK